MIIKKEGQINNCPFFIAIHIKNIANSQVVYYLTFWSYYYLNKNKSHE